MKIIDNFVELLQDENFSELKVKFLKIEKFNDYEFNQKVPLNLLTADELNVLDTIITKILKLYPILYPNLVVTSNTNTFRRNNNNDNKKLEQIFLSRIEEKKISEAIDVFCAKAPRKLSNDDIMLKIKDQNLALLYETLNDFLTREITIEMIFSEIFLLLKEHCSNIVVIDENLKNLSKFLTLEVYLRTKFPEEYVFSDEFYKVEQSFDNLQKYKKNNIFNIIKKGLQNKTASEILNDLNIQLLS